MKEASELAGRAKMIVAHTCQYRQYASASFITLWSL